MICSRSKFCDCHKLLELEILTQKDYKITFFISRCTHSFLPVVLPVWQTWIFFISIFRFYKMIHTRSDCISFDFTSKPSWSSYQYFWLCFLHLRSLPKFWMWIQMMSQKSPARQVNHKKSIKILLKTSFKFSTEREAFNYREHLVDLTRFFPGFDYNNDLTDDGAEMLESAGGYAVWIFFAWFWKPKKYLKEFC